jgi:hypothetical protein
LLLFTTLKLAKKYLRALDMEALQEKSASAIEFVAQKVMEVSGMTPKAVDEEGKGN